ncbi:protein kinase domain-containing protein [uncultured Streptomyces sp.]|uniref:protein kinase domain-containing protein n=1 Tax=uncultured Streptomyces sp. TaxID=174707 RepID=UPI002621D517|nr:protein kinase [uncultured Streptomyces sp.]
MAPLQGAGPDPEAEHPEYAGQYRLEACLGEGGMGVVHLARSASGLRLAVKVVHRQYAADPDFRARFRQEVAAARRVSGAFTAPVVDADPDAALPWMATLHIPGPTLAAQVKRNGPLSPAQLRRLTAGLAEALRDIHRAGVIHRDLKPSNVLLSDSGPKVIDFGISRPYDSDLRTETGKLIGSPPYMAPEQFQRPREVGPAADVFALGAVLVHAATGRGPFDSDSPYLVAYQVVHDEADLAGVPEDLAPLVGRCLAKDPADRPTPDGIMAALRPPSYEAAAFVPAQRRAPTGPPVEPGPVAGRGNAGAGAAEPAEGPQTPVTHLRDGGGAVRGRRWPAGRTAVVATALAVLVGAGAVALSSADGDPAAPSGPGARSPAAPAAFTAWRTALSAAAGSTPSCVGSAGAGGADGALFCTAAGYGTARLDPSDGRVVWEHRDASREAVALSTSPGGPLLASATGALRAYGPDGGKPLWDTRPQDGSGGAFPAGNTLLLIGSDGTVRGLDSATGDSRWHHRLDGHVRPYYGSYDAVTGLVHLFENAADGTTTLVTAVEARTGATHWQRRLDGLLTPRGTTGDGALVLTSADLTSQTDALVRYDPGRARAERLPLPFRMAEPEVVVGDDSAYLLARGGTLVAVGVASGGGGERWRLETAVGLTSSPVLGSGGRRLYFTAADGRLLAVDTGEGTLLGQTGARLKEGKLSLASWLPAPAVLGRNVIGTAPDGSVFAVDGDDPAGW